MANGAPNIKGWRGWTLWSCRSPFSVTSPATRREELVGVQVAPIREQRLRPRDPGDPRAPSRAAARGSPKLLRRDQEAQELGVRRTPSTFAWSSMRPTPGGNGALPAVPRHWGLLVNAPGTPPTAIDPTCRVEFHPSGGQGRSDLHRCCSAILGGAITEGQHADETVEPLTAARFTLGDGDPRPGHSDSVPVRGPGGLKDCEWVRALLRLVAVRGSAFS
jgi:hypothetical protein